MDNLQETWDTFFPDPLPYLQIQPYMQDEVQAIRELLELRGVFATDLQVIFFWKLHSSQRMENWISTSNTIVENSVKNFLRDPGNWYQQVLQERQSLEEFLNISYVPLENQRIITQADWDEALSHYLSDHEEVQSFMRSTLIFLRKYLREKTIFATDQQLMGWWEYYSNYMDVPWLQQPPYAMKDEIESFLRAPETWKKGRQPQHV